MRAGLVQAPSRYRWSSAAAHLRGRDEVLVQVAPLLPMAPNWRRLLTSAIREGELKALRAHERTGRLLGDKNFLALLEQNLGRTLRRQKPGPKNVQERSSQTRNHGTTPPYGRELPPGRTRKGEVDSDSLFRVFRWIPWLISDPSGAAIGCCWTETAVLRLRGLDLTRQVAMAPHSPVRPNRWCLA